MHLTTQDIQLHTWKAEDEAKFSLVGSMCVKKLPDEASINIVNS